MYFVLPKKKFKFKSINSVTGIFVTDSDMDIKILKTYPLKFGEIKDKDGNIINKSAVDINDLTPDENWLKKDIKSWMINKRILYNSGDTKNDLLVKIKYHNKK